MVGVDSGSLYRRTHGLSRLAWSCNGRRPLGAVLHSSNEPGELSQWLCHDDSTINIVLELLLLLLLLLLFSSTVMAVRRTEYQTDNAQVLALNPLTLNL